MYELNRTPLRDQFFSVWQKHLQEQTLNPLEQQILLVIQEHPEYQAIFEDRDSHLDKEFDQTNPFLHLSLHLSLREQIATDRPQGIRQLFQQAITQQNIHEVEHKMMACLGDMLWQSLNQPQPIDEQTYLDKLCLALS